MGRGYWEIVIRPKRFAKGALEQKTLRETIINSSYASRGWRYPLVSTDPGEQEHAYAVQNGIEGWVDFGKHREVWRFDTSGQFVHYLAFVEDWWDRESEDWIPDVVKQHPVGSALSTIGTVYLLTEVLEFARRLSNNVPDMEDVHVEVTAHGLENRELATYDSRRHLFGSYKCRISELSLTPIEVSRDELQGGVQPLALGLITELFAMFNWPNIPTKVLEEDQNKLLEGRL